MGVHPKLVRGACAMGIDVRYGIWDCYIAEFVRPAADRPVARLVFGGTLRHEGEDGPDPETLAEYLLTQYPVRGGGIDARPDGSTAKKFVNKVRRRFRL